MRGALRMAFSVAVVAGWLMALIWLAVSVSQIAVERTVVPSCAVAEPGEVAC